MPPGPATVFVDYPGASADVAAMRVGGVRIVERIVRDAAARGATAVIVRGDRVPSLPAALPVSRIAADEAPPDGATQVPGDIVAGVQVTDERSRRAAHRALLQTCRRPYDGPGDRYVIRAFSLRLTGLLCQIGVTPNQVTSANIVVGFAACCFAALGTRSAFAIAGALMFLQVVFDSSDGELARIRYLSSKFGMWLDNVSDDVIDNLFVAMMGIGLGGIWLPIALVGAISRSLCAIMIHVDVARMGKPGDVMAFTWWFDTAGEELAERFVAKTDIITLGRAFGRRDLYVLVWAAACLAGYPMIGLSISVIVSLVYFGLAIAHTLKKRY